MACLSAYEWRSRQAPIKCVNVAIRRWRISLLPSRLAAFSPYHRFFNVFTRR
ncbi:hypothetical protein KCP75_05705 [Salmonella enterica subsp. enterica]|nr:hypothetical protein KCP75_05705 [Salmonella enterica subsp. enterica]